MGTATAAAGQVNVQFLMHAKVGRKVVMYQLYTVSNLVVDRLMLDVQLVVAGGGGLVQWVATA
ncbi:hypothetical protein D3C79_999370 [compost metagenome]